MEGEMDTELLRRMAKDELVHTLLDAAPGPKDLVIEESLMKPLDRIAGASVLKQHETEKIFRLDGKKLLPWSEAAQYRLYIVRPTMANAKFITDHILAHKASGEVGKEFAVVFVPRKLSTCELVFEQHGVFGDVALHEFNPSLIPMEPDLLSLELPDFFWTFYLHNTAQWVHSVGKSLWHLQYLYGTIPRTYGIGAAAEQVAKMVDTLFWELGEPKSSASQPFSHLFLMDRNIDFATVLMSSLTYESLLDECFGVNCGFVEFGSDVTKTDKGTKILLSNQDEVFAAIRDRHFSHVFSFLSEKVKQLQSSYDKGQKAQGVSEMQNFVANELRGLKQQHKSLQLHIGASEVVMSRKAKEQFEDQLKAEQNIVSGYGTKEAIAYLEDSMCQQLPENRVLALISLLSLTQNGLGNKDFLSLRNQFLHAYGHKHLYTFHNLKKLGVIFEKDRSLGSVARNLNAGQLPIPASSTGSTSTGSKLPSFQALSRKLNLIPKSDDINLKNPSDMSYLFNGAYTPAICQILANSLQFGFNKDELSRTFSCPIVSKDSPLFPGGNKPVENRVRRSILVYFLGGVTTAELAAIRLISRQRGVHIVVATTHIINRHQFMKTMAEA